MPEQDPKIKELEDRLDALVRTQIDFQREISAIRGELVRLNARKAMSEQERPTPSFYVPEQRATSDATQRPVEPKPPVITPRPPVTPPYTEQLRSNAPQPPREKPPVKESTYELPKRTPYVADPVLSQATTTSDAFSRFVSQYAETARENLEEFIGKNLISLIGIIVLILGVGIGAKYAIDNNLISPLTRIIVGYIFGFGLVGLAIKLKRDYLNFSAVLISGGMAIMYFVTYFAYSAYNLISQPSAFGLMIMFTVCTVTAALLYSRQVIAHIGLVGAYAVPFLLSNDSGNYLVLFIYMTVINTGILAIGVKKDWKPIFYTSSLFTWAIFGGWFATKYSPEHFSLALVFLALFFAIFYATKLVQAHFIEAGDDITENLVSNVLTVVVFYSMCYALAVNMSNDPIRNWTLLTYLGAASSIVVAASLRFYRQPFILYTSGLFTWLILASWFATTYSSEYFALALVFSAVFLVLFSVSLIVQRRKSETDTDRTANLVATLLNNSAFYGMCFAILLNTPADATRYWTYFAYVAVASSMIVAASLRFLRQPFVLYASWLFTWGILATWFGNNYSPDHFALTLVFSAVFFALFFVALLVHRRSIENDSDRAVNLIASILTGAALYGMCFAVLVNTPRDAAHYWIFFTYVAVASSVMLAASFKFYGRAFIYLVVPFVWAIYGSWFGSFYDRGEDFQLAAVFAAANFSIIYFSIIFHRLVEDNFTLIEHTSLILSNAFIFFGFGYALLDQNATLNPYLGLYTAANAALHLIVALSVRTFAKKAVDVVQVLTILVLTFSSIAVPVQFDGNVVTMVWATEGAMLFWYGRTRAVRLFERFSYPVMILATGSMFLDWATSYSLRASVDGGPLAPFANSDFVTAIVFVTAFGFIYLTSRDRRYEPAIASELVRPVGVIIAVVGVIALYNMFRTEISNYFFLQSVNSAADYRRLQDSVGDLQLFNIAWQINYTVFFLIGMAAVNLRKLRSTSLGVVNSVLAVVSLAAFATASLAIFHELRTTFMAGTFNPDVISHWMYIGIRPISYLLAAGLLYLLYEYSKDSLLDDRVESDVLAHFYEAVVYTFSFVVASCELVNLMAQVGIPDATKLGLTILWGGYALMLIIIGIAKDKKHLRIAAIVLLAVTLVKLFFYDIADLDTIPKTILFVTLGITLLLISFLYNKYKGVIFKTEAVQEE